VNSDMILFIVGFIYLSLVIGIFTKYYIKGIRGKYLIISLFVPIIVFLQFVEISIKHIVKERSVLTQKFKNIYFLFKITAVGFPILVSVIGELLLEIINNEKKLLLKPSIYNYREKYYKSILDLRTKFV